jgi:hypothetical protein
MSQWSHNHPEKMAEIAALPSSQRHRALLEAIGYDPDRIREELEERNDWLRCECGALNSVPPTVMAPVCRICGELLAHGDGDGD